MLVLGFEKLGSVILSLNGLIATMLLLKLLHQDAFMIRQLLQDALRERTDNQM